MTTLPANVIPLTPRDDPDDERCAQCGTPGLTPDSRAYLDTVVLGAGSELQLGTYVINTEELPMVWCGIGCFLLFADRRYDRL